LERKSRGIARADRLGRGEEKKKKGEEKEKETARLHKNPSLSGDSVRQGTQYAYREGCLPRDYA